MRNEMRGFFFLSYALFCFAIYYLSGGFYYGGGNIWIGLAAIFLIIGIGILTIIIIIIINFIKKRKIKFLYLR